MGDPLLGPTQAGVVGSPTTTAIGLAPGAAPTLVPSSGQVTVSGSQLLSALGLAMPPVSADVPPATVAPDPTAPPSHLVFVAALGLLLLWWIASDFSHIPR